MSLKALLWAVTIGLLSFLGGALGLCPGRPRPAPPPDPPLRRPRRGKPARDSPPPPDLPETAPIAFPLGTRPEQSGRPFVFTEKHASLHQLVLGTTGSGKSRYCELQCRFLMDSMRGFCFLDLDGDTAENLLAYASKKREEEGSDAICRQVVYVELSFATLFGYDPFLPPDFAHLPAELRENAYQSWLSVKIDQFGEIVQAKQGASDFTGMARLQRVLRTVLYAVGTAVNDDGRHLPLSEVFALLDCDHPRHGDVYEVVGPHLPGHVRTEFERWQGADRRQRLLETESTLNRLRSLLSPLVLAVFTEPARHLSFRDAIDRRMILLVNLRQSDFLSADQQRAIATLFVHEIWSACKVAGRYERPVSPYYLFIDECHLLMETAGSDLEQILCRGRKYKLSLTVIGQFLGQFRNERIDMTPALLNLCRSFACFLHMHPEDLDVLKRYFGYPNLDFTPLHHVTDRPDGYDLVKLKDYARGYTCGTTWSAGLNATHAEGSADAKGKSRTHTDTVTQTEGENEQEGETTGGGRGVVRQYDADGRPLGKSEGVNDNAGRSAGRGKNRMRGSSSADSLAENETHTDNTQDSIGASAGVGGSETRSESETEKTTVVPRTREEWHPTGKLLHAVEDQFHQVAHRIATLRDRQAMVRLYGEGRTFRMDVGDVPDVCPDPAEMAARLREFKARVYASHSCYFAPDLSAAAQDARLDAWLADVQGPVPAGPAPLPDNGWGN